MSIRRRVTTLSTGFSQRRFCQAPRLPMHEWRHHVRMTAADKRLGNAVDVVLRARRADGRWPTYAGYAGRTWFQMEAPGPSRWNTVRALHVLNWWKAAS